MLCEKPIAISLGEADRMIAAADEAGIRFGVIFQRRFWPSVQRMRAAIDAGKLGAVTLGSCTVRLWRGRTTSPPIRGGAPGRPRAAAC